MMREETKVFKKQFDELVLIKEEVDNSPTSLVECMIERGLIMKVKKCLEREGRSDS
jgi:hypothetical protein